MSTNRKTLRLNAANPADIFRAAEILRSNGIVAFPTETVYGLGANALAPDAIEKIFVAKQRPHWDPLIVHLADRAQLTQIASASPLAERLMDAFWPGPLTLLLPKTEAIPNAVTAGRPLVGVRIPNHPVAQALLRAVGVPIAAPSANTFGHTSPTTAAHVLADLDGRIDAILDGGPTQVGLESTVAEVRGQGVVIFRLGAVDAAMIDSIVGVTGAWVHEPDDSDRPPASLPSPGIGIRHYAPRARLILVDTTLKTSAHSYIRPELSLVETIEEHAARSDIIGVMLPDAWNSSAAHFIFPWGSWRDQEILAQRLYTGLRHLDDQGCTVILCPVPESSGLAQAIRDRLQKAAR